MSISNLISQVKSNPANVEFSQVINVITENYDYVPCEFSNGDLVSAAGTNEGSCKIFYFAKLNKLTETETLALFGQYYREDVLGNPKGNDHGNIRNFMVTGWNAVSFVDEALAAKS